MTSKDESTERRAEATDATQAPVLDTQPVLDLKPAPSTAISDSKDTATPATDATPIELDTSRQPKKSSKTSSPLVGGAGAPLVRTGVAYALAALSGFLYFLSFAGMDIWPLAFVCFIPLWVAIQNQSPKTAVRLGILAGLTMNLTGFSWLLGMLQTFSGFPLPLCAVFMVILCGYQGGRFGLMGWLHARAADRGWPRAPVFVLAFVASELCYPLLFPWYFAASMHKIPLMTQSADIGGPILIGCVLLAVNLAFGELIVARLERRKPVRIQLALGFGSLALNLVYSAIRIIQVDKTASTSEGLKVGIAQGNMSLLGKRNNPEEGLARHMRLSSDLRAAGAELLVWSESSVAFAVPEDNTDAFMRRKFTSRLEVPTIFGAVLYRGNPDPSLERFFNVALATDATGKVTSRYDKQFLLAFGEYIPFGDRFPVVYKWSPHSGKFSPGSSQAPLTVTIHGAPHRITTLICYEDILPGFTNDAVVEGKPDLLVNITNDAWFGDTAEPWEHLALAKFRAIEHHRYLIRSTNSGVSAVIDPVGRSVFETKTFVEDARVADVHFMNNPTVFEFLGQKPHLFASLAVLFMAFRRKKDPGTAAAA